MPRPRTLRAISHGLKAGLFKPAGIPASELAEIVLSLDELEAVRIADLRGLYQEAAARELGVSRQTFGRILESAHKKIAEALINGSALRIEGGPVSPCKRRKTMKVAIALAPNGNELEEHFGQCSRLGVVVFDEEGTLSEQKEIEVPSEAGCRSSLAPFLARNGVTHLLAGRLGGGVRNSFESHGIAVVAGLSGNAEAALQAFRRGNLEPGESSCSCGSHDRDGHSCGCGESGAASHESHSCSCGGHDTSHGGGRALR